MAGESGLNPGFSQNLYAMIAASGGKITIRSGYRSVGEQQQLWNAAVNKYGSEAAARKWVAPPGKSNHNRGMAVDLGGDLALAHRLAPRFGLTFPMGHEPWHIEPANLRTSKDAYTTPPDDGGHSHDDPNAPIDPTTGRPYPQEPENKELKTLRGQLMNFVDILSGPTYIEDEEV